jgi:hypothetical protein
LVTTSSAVQALLSKYDDTRESTTAIGHIKKGSRGQAIERNLNSDSGKHESRQGLMISKDKRRNNEKRQSSTGGSENP